MPKFKKIKTKVGGTQLIIASHKGKKVEYVGAYHELRVAGKNEIAGSINIAPTSSSYGRVSIHATSVADALKVVKALDKGIKVLKKHRKAIEVAYKTRR